MRRRVVLILTLALTALAAPVAGAAVKVTDRVDANGEFVGEVVPAEPLTDLVQPSTSAAYRPAPVLGARKVAVIPMEFTGRPLPFTSAQIRSTVFTGTDSVNEFMRESSYGLISLRGRDAADGDVYPTVQIAEDPATCDEDAYGRAAIAALQAQGHTTLLGGGLDGYQHYIFIWPNLASCGGWAGLGMMPGRETWINGYLDRAVISHELGHNFGLAHADTLSCRDGVGAPVVLSNVCTSHAYGDPYETMGMFGMQFNAAHRAFLGWTQAGQNVKVTGNATVTLESASIAGSGIKSIEIPRGAAESWFVEVRSAAGQYDNFAPAAQVLQGVLVRRHAEGTRFAAETELLDAHPTTSSVSDAAFVPGETFADPVIGLRLTVIARTATTATVGVTFGDAAAPTEPPSTPTTTEATATSPSGTSATTPSIPVTVTTDPAVARRWTSRVSVRRLADGRVVIVGRVLTRAMTCAYRVRATVLSRGRCSRLTGATGWRVYRTVRGGTYVTVTAVSASGRVLISKRMRVPSTAGVVRTYRL